MRVVVGTPAGVRVGVAVATTGVGILNGGRGGADSESGGRKAIYKHLATHLEDAGREPPPLED